LLGLRDIAYGVFLGYLSSPLYLKVANV